MVHYPERSLSTPIIDGIAFLFLQTRQSVKDADQCRLLGNFFGYFIQVALGILAFLSLVYKRYKDVPRRPWLIWGMDASKQALGAFAAHGWNVLFALFLHKASSHSLNPCVLYFITFMVDAFLGLLFNFIFLLLIEQLAIVCGSDIMKSGDYGNPPRWKVWLVQITSWVLIITAVKFLLLYCVLIPLMDPLYTVGHWLLVGFDPYPKLELVIVMILVPLVVNVVVFWISDNFLMNQSPTDNVVRDGVANDTEAGRPNYTSLADLDKTSRLRHVLL